MIDKKRKQCHLHFKATCDPKTSNCGKHLILLVSNSIVYQRRMVTSTYVMLKAGLPRQMCSEKLLQIRKNTFQH